ncbi:hypothetical protein MCEGE10_00656 [Flavobacteriaceae bacterium]
MRNSILLTLLLLPIALMAQVGIGTTIPNESAKLDVTSTSQGFLPPRVALTATSDATTIKNAAGTSITPATGLFVYNTATAGTSPSNVTPGIYYYDGSKWQRIINQQPDATIEFNTTDPNSGSPTFNPITPASKDYVYVSSIDNSQWTYNGTTYVTYTPPSSTAWNLAGGTTDAGSNKTGDIVRAGKVGIGTTTPNASAKLDVTSTTQGFLPPRVALTRTTDNTTIKNTAGTAVTPATGLLVYNTATTTAGTNDVTPGYYYYNGTNWVQLAIASVSNTYKLVSTATALVNSPQSLTSPSALNTFVDVTNSSMTVTIPSGYTSAQIVVRWDMWGDVTTGNSAMGSLKFDIAQSGTAGDYKGSIMVTSWATTTNSTVRWSAPVAYVFSGLAAGTYTFQLRIQRLTEAGTISNAFIYGATGLAQVFVK